MTDDPFPREFAPSRATFSRECPDCRQSGDFDYCDFLCDLPSATDYGLPIPGVTELARELLTRAERRQVAPGDWFPALDAASRWLNAELRDSPGTDAIIRILPGHRLKVGRSHE